MRRRVKHERFESCLTTEAQWLHDTSVTVECREITTNCFREQETAFVRRQSSAINCKWKVMFLHLTIHAKSTIVHVNETRSDIMTGFAHEYWTYVFERNKDSDGGNSQSVQHEPWGLFNQQIHFDWLNQWTLSMLKTIPHLSNAWLTIAMIISVEVRCFAILPWGVVVHNALICELLELPWHKQTCGVRLRADSIGLCQAVWVTPNWLVKWRSFASVGRKKHLQMSGSHLSESWHTQDSACRTKFFSTEAQLFCRFAAQTDPNAKTSHNPTSVGPFLFPPQQILRHHWEEITFTVSSSTPCGVVIVT